MLVDGEKERLKRSWFQGRSKEKRKKKNHLSKEKLVWLIKYGEVKNKYRFLVRLSSNQ